MQPPLELVAERIDRDPLLAHIVAMTHGHAPVVERFEIDREAEGRANLVVSSVALSNVSGRLLITIPVLFSKLVTIEPTLSAVFVVDTLSSDSPIMITVSLFSVSNTTAVLFCKLVSFANIAPVEFVSFANIAPVEFP